MKSLYDSLNLVDPRTPDKPPVDPILKLTGKAFSKAVVESQEYRESIVRRVRLDSLPPAVETKLLDHAWGVPKQRVEIDDKRNPFEGLPADEIEAHLQKLALIARDLRRTNDAVHSGSKIKPPEPSSSVH